MEQTNYSEIILQAISSMDMDRLQFYLNEEYSYQDAPKEVFLRELEKLFDEHKKLGDTELLIYEGKCAGRGCENCNKNGFRFIGNHSRNYLDLIFTVEGDDVKDIFECLRFKTTEYHEELQSKSSIDINTDDLITFDKTPEYWIKVNSALAAYDELITSRPRRLSYDDMCYWLNRHQYTIKNIADDDFILSRSRWYPFTKLYEQLTELRKYIAFYTDKFDAANNAYKLINEEKQLITWMLEYETMYAAVPYDFKFDISEKHEGYVSELVDSIIFCDPLLAEVFIFILHYKKNHLVVLNKYGIYTEDEISAVIGHEQYDYTANPVYSLKYHLEKRVEAARLGIQIPFNLNGYV